jgi:hypothetical protein
VAEVLAETLELRVEATGGDQGRALARRVDGVRVGWPAACFALGQVLRAVGGGDRIAEGFVGGVGELVAVGGGAGTFVQGPVSQPTVPYST